MTKLRKEKLKISGMHCVSCAMNIDGDLEDTNGVESANTSYIKQECEVAFDEKKINLKEIIKIVEKTGYQAKTIAT